MKSDVRVRFAPSPTGMPHLGSLRTALFNFLYARHEGGAFLLRIEDTDRERSRPEYQNAMMRILHWAGMEPDEPIMIQSERISIYHAVAQALIDEGKAYRCVCTPAQLTERVMRTSPDGTVYGKYDGLCRFRGITADEPGVIRFALPDQLKSISVQDTIKGDLSFDRDALDDFILIRSDGGPMYNFAVVVDDIAMRISHIIRGEEHLVNTPKQILLYQALNAPLPIFAHLPLILGPDGSKLSKRDAAADAMEYLRKGYLPMALMNYIVRLGWSHGDDELFFDMAQIARLFTLQGITHKGALFDWKKLDWVNQQHLLRQTVPEIISYMAAWMDVDVASRLQLWSSEQIQVALSLYIPRVHTLGQLLDLVSSLHDRPTSYEIPVLDGSYSDAFQTLEEALSKYDTLSISEAQALLKTAQPLPLGKVGPSIRVALTGRLAAPGIGEIIALLGGRESAARMRQYRTMLP